MKVQLTLSDFPIALVNMFVKDVSKRIDAIDIQVGGENTVYVTFSTSDIVKVQEIAIVCDKYMFGGETDDSEILFGDEEPKLLRDRSV